MAALWAAYREALTRRPWAVNVVTTSGLLLTGDVICQTLFPQPKDSPLRGPARTAVMTSWGVAFGSTFVFWIGFLDRKMPARTFAVGAVKSLLTAACIAPPLNAAFLAYSTTLEHAFIVPHDQNSLVHASAAQQLHAKGLWPAVKIQVTTKLVPIVMSSAGYWFTLNTLNWMFIPPQYRVLASSIATIPWMVFLSYMQHKDAVDDEHVASNTAVAK